MPNASVAAVESSTNGFRNWYWGLPRASSRQGEPSARVLDGNTWRNRPSLTSLERAWCRQHEPAQTSATRTGPAVSIHPYTNDLNTVFVEKD